MLYGFTAGDIAVEMCPSQRRVAHPSLTLPPWLLSTWRGTSGRGWRFGRCWDGGVAACCGMFYFRELAGLVQGPGQRRGN